MRKILLFWLIISPLLLQAQQLPSNARAVALGGIGQSLVAPSAAYYNQAALARLQTRFSANIFYRGLLGVPGLSDRSFAIAYKPWQNSAIGLDYHFTGIDVYSSQRAGIAYGMRAAKGLYLGAQVNLHLIRQPAYYGSIYTASAELSLLITPIEDLVIATHIYNFLYGIINSTIPAMAEIALGYNFSEKVFFIAEVEKQINQPVVWRWGTSYMPIKNMHLDVGGYLLDDIYTITFGTGYKSRRLGVALGFESHPILGLSSSISLAFTL